jgi:biopolymer transport protein TolQ
MKSSLKKSALTSFGKSITLRFLLPQLSALFLQSAWAASAKVGVKAGVFDGIFQASLPVQVLLLFLVAASITSWAIIFTKSGQLKTLEKSNDEFSERFWKASSLEAVNEKLSDFPKSNLAHTFRAGYVELQSIADSSLSSGTSPGDTAPRLSGLDNLERALRKRIDNEISDAESRLGFLATTGSTAPFVGLLGTVIGIMTSFTGIAASGSASLAVVAPGIAEALFSTAVGLFAAIPAVVAYNYFIGRIRKLEIELNNFASDFLNIAKRNFFRDQ